MSTPTFADMSPQVLSRLEDPTAIFWSQQYEVYTALSEALNDLLLLIGRPTQIVNQPFTLAANTAWQSLPIGVMAITDMFGSDGQLRRVTLADLDYVQSSWGSIWETDVSDSGPARWAPLGFNLIAVHPVPTVPVTLTYNGIQYPVTSSWPYVGTQPIPFHDELMAALEQYAAMYCRIKEGSAEFQQGLQLYRDYLTTARRLTQIEDRRDPIVFSPAFGLQSGTNNLVRR